MAVNRPEPGMASEDALRDAELRAALEDVVEGLALVDGSDLDRAEQLQLGRARSAGRAAARLIQPAGGDGPLDLHGLLADLEARWGGRAVTRQTALALAVSAGAPRSLAVDPALLERSLGNLLSHAIAGGQGGSVRLLVEVAAETLRFVVEEHGRVPHEAPGSDVGLAVARALARAAGGGLSVRHSETEGLRAELVLPLETARADTAGTDPLPDLSGLRICLMPLPEDEAAALARIVARFGGEVVDPAGEPAEGAMPVFVLDADAGDAGAALRHLATVRAAAVVAITGVPLASLRDGLRRSGVDAVLTRPFPDAAVVGRVLGEAVAARTRHEDAAAPACDAAQLDHLLALAGPEIALELLDRMVEDLGAVAAGLDAAIPALDTSELRAQTHVLISLAGAVGADRLQKLAEDMNAAAHAADAIRIGRLGAAAGPELARLIAHVDTVRQERRARP